ncbi:hypothetical protein RCL1_007500 [Eukaryota sp. TZLM3-RCL]
MTYTNKEVAQFYFSFKETEPDAVRPLSPSGKKKQVYSCGYCSTERTRIEGSDWTNLSDHVFHKHPDFHAVMTAATYASQPGASSFTTKINSRIFASLDWVFNGRLPYNFLSKKVTKKYANFKPISYNTLMKYSEALVSTV